MAGSRARKVTHRALDGTAITLSGELDLSRPYSSVIRLDFANRLHELTAVDRRFGMEWATSLGVPKLTEEYGFQGGRLRIGHGQVADESLHDFPRLLGAKATERVTAAVWEGRAHSLCGHFYFAQTSDVIRLFDAVRITEHADGISLLPKRGKRVTIAETASVAKEVPGVGLLEISGLNRETARQLPRWSGTRLATGELFRDTHGDGSVYFVFATPTAVVTVLPDEDEVRRAPARLGALTVQATG